MVKVSAKSQCWKIFARMPLNSSTAVVWKSREAEYLPSFVPSTQGIGLTVCPGLSTSINWPFLDKKKFNAGRWCVEKCIFSSKDLLFDASILFQDPTWTKYAVYRRKRKQTIVNMIVYNSLFDQKSITISLQSPANRTNIKVAKIAFSRNWEILISFCRLRMRRLFSFIC